MRPIDMAGADEKCAELHVGVSEKPETVVVNDNGTLQNVFVWVKSGSEGWSFPMPEGDALLDQKGCMYKQRRGRDARRSAAAPRGLEQRDVVFPVHSNWRSRRSCSPLQSMQKSATGRARRRCNPISSPQLSHSP